MALINRLIALFLIACLLPSCVSSRQDQFGYAAMKGNVSGLRQFNEPGYSRMRITETNGQKSVPMQYAIIQGNKPMADFLIENGGHRTLNGQNLTYYSARNGYPTMAKHFASRGIGSYSDIQKAKRDKQAARKRSNQGALIALGVLAALMSGGGSSSGSSSGACYSCGSSLGGLTPHDGLCTGCRAFAAGVGAN